MAENSRPLRAVVLAAGKGKRMKSAKPKVLHDVLGRTILTRVINAVNGVGAQWVHIVVGHESEQVEEFLQSQHKNESWKTHVQEPQLGTGHALMQVVPDLEGFKGDLLVTVGDAPLLSAGTLHELVELHRNDNAAVAVLTAEVDDPKNYGRVLRNKDGHVRAIVEDKDAAEEEKKVHEINTAIYCFKWPDIQDGLANLKNDNKQGEYYLPDLVGWAVKKGLKVSAFKASDYREVAGINSRLELQEAIGHLKDLTVERLALESGVTIIDPSSTWIAPEVIIGQDTVILPGCHILGRVKIGPNCTIGPNSVIKGDVSIGEHTSVVLSVVLDSIIANDCKIGPYAHVREGNTVGEGARVGNFVELKKSSIGSHTNVSHLSYVGDTTVGSNANIGAGTITANYDHLTKKKECTVIGDGASTGSNSVLVAPVHIGNQAVVAGGSVITKDVPDGALGIGRARQTNIDGWIDRKKEALASTSNV